MEGRRRLVCFLFMILLMEENQFFATSRPLGSDFSLDTKGKMKEGSKDAINGEEISGLTKKIGSSPPSCEHKCYGCTPCEAIQVPETSKRVHVGLQYANYEPEGWKCKCGPSFYSP